MTSIVWGLDENMFTENELLSQVVRGTLWWQNSLEWAYHEWEFCGEVNSRNMYLCSWCLCVGLLEVRSVILNTYSHTVFFLLSHKQSQPINMVLKEHRRKGCNLIGCWAQILTTFRETESQTASSTGFLLETNVLRNVDIFNDMKS